MTKVIFDKVLAKLLNTPMVIEEGSGTTTPTAGPTTAVNWKWRKYSNGTVECWGSTVATYNLNEGPYGGEYYMHATWPLPANLFIETPFSGVVNRFGNGGNGLITTSTYTVTKTYISFFVYNPTSYNSTIGISAYLVGKWSTYDPSTQTMDITGFSQTQMTKAEIRALIENSGNIYKDNNLWIPTNLE